MAATEAAGRLALEVDSVLTGTGRLAGGARPVAAAQGGAELEVVGLAQKSLIRGPTEGLGVPPGPAVPDGVVYSRIDLNGSVLPYGGQAQSYERYLERQIEHARAHPDADFEFTIGDRANPGVELDVAEHRYIQELTGGVRASKSPLVSNLKDPVGPARRPALGLPKPRTE